MSVAHSDDAMSPGAGRQTEHGLQQSSRGSRCSCHITKVEDVEGGLQSAEHADSSRVVDG